MVRNCGPRGKNAPNAVSSRRLIFRTDSATDMQIPGDFSECHVRLSLSRRLHLKSPQFRADERSRKTRLSAREVAEGGTHLAGFGPRIAASEPRGGSSRDSRLTRFSPSRNFPSSSPRRSPAFETRHSLPFALLGRAATASRHGSPVVPRSRCTPLFLPSCTPGTARRNVA